MLHLLLSGLHAPPPVRTVPGDEGQVFSRESQGPEHKQRRAVSPRPVHQRDPPPLHPEYGQSPGPSQHGEAAVQYHVTRELSADGRPPHHPAQELEQEKQGEGQLEAVEAGARDEFGLHGGAILLVADAVDGAKEEGDGEQDGGDKGKVEAGGDA